ncbi:MAG: hypothetical protein LQ345_002224, partial [Seirophora villosa]
MAGSTVREDLIRDLRGRTIHVPDLHDVMPDWPHAINPQIESLRRDVEARLDSLFSAERSAKLKAADPAYFASAWWPYASYERLQVATYLALWLFLWDDGGLSLKPSIRQCLLFTTRTETDSTEFSSMSQDFDSTQAFRDRTLIFVRASLGYGDPTADVPDVENDTVITCFYVVGKAIRNAYSPTQTGRLLAQIERFLNMQALEHRVSLSDKLPTVEQYQHRRMGTSAVGVCLAIS